MCQWGDTDMKRTHFSRMNRKKMMLRARVCVYEVKPRIPGRIWVGKKINIQRVDFFSFILIFKFVFYTYTYTCTHSHALIPTSPYIEIVRGDEGVRLQACVGWLVSHTPASEMRGTKRFYGTNTENKFTEFSRNRVEKAVNWTFYLQNGWMEWEQESDKIRRAAKIFLC